MNCWGYEWLPEYEGRGVDLGETVEPAHQDGVLKENWGCCGFSKPLWYVVSFDDSGGLELFGLSPVSLGHFSYGQEKVTFTVPGTHGPGCVCDP